MGLVDDVLSMDTEARFDVVVKPSDCEAPDALECRRPDRELRPELGRCLLLNMVTESVEDTKRCRQAACQVLRE